MVSAMGAQYKVASVVFPAMPAPAVRLERVAIVMMSAIGDAVHVLPIINAIKRHSPRSRVTWFLAPRPATLVRGHPAIDEIIEFAARGGLSAWRDMRRSLASREFDVVLDLQVAIKAGLLTTLINAPVKVGFDRRRARDLNWVFTNSKIPARANQHVQDQYFEFLDFIGVPHDRVEWGLGPWANERGTLEALLPARPPRFASIAVATTKPDKDWPAERWADVIDVLHEKYALSSVLVGGRSPVERAAEDTIMARARQKPASTLGCSLREMVSVLDASTLVLSPDTAPMHIANALGRPVIALFGATDPKRTGPYGKSQDLVVNAFSDPGDPEGIIMDRRLGRVKTIRVEDVLAKVDLWHRKSA
jgi:heptosyltransferase I